MDLTWLGTAGFIVKTKEAEIVFDPFLTRGRGQASPFTIDSFQNAQALLVGHGHFDHTLDIPDIVAGTDLKVYAPGITGKMLKMRGVPSSRLVEASNREILFKALKLRAFKSSHVKFDLPLIMSTIKQCGVGDCLHVAHLGLSYPAGLVQTYLFEVRGKKVLFASTAGFSEEELHIYRKLEVDYFLAPLQGHSKIQELVSRQINIIQPKVVIPHHHDDFYPPLSQNISIPLLRDKLNHLGFKGIVLEIPLFEGCQL